MCMREHISMDRAWVLIQEGGLLSAAEREHLDICGECAEFLNGFVTVARYVGLSVRFPDADGVFTRREHAA
jgi:hypothetical protein